jgi:arsenate reductase (glutaredoxin)
MTIQVYGIPTCSTCKKALQWLNANHLTYEFINTQQHPPSLQQISEWVASFGSKPMRNTSGGSYRALGEEKKTWSEEKWILAFAEDAMLLKRPLILKDGAPILVGFRATDECLRERLGLTPQQV